jgi:hypothetical protein
MHANLERSGILGRPVKPDDDSSHAARMQLLIRISNSQALAFPRRRASLSF